MQARQIVFNVWNYFSQSTTTNPVKETMTATSVKGSMVQKIQQNGVVSPKKPGPKTKRVQATVDDFDQGAIWRIIPNLYANKRRRMIKNPSTTLPEEHSKSHRTAATYRWTSWKKDHRP